jgi:hypothetical protein
VKCVDHGPGRSARLLICTSATRQRTQAGTLGEGLTPRTRSCRCQGTARTAQCHNVAVQRRRHGSGTRTVRCRCTCGVPGRTSAAPDAASSARSRSRGDRDPRGQPDRGHDEHLHVAPDVSREVVDRMARASPSGAASCRPPGPPSGRSVLPLPRSPASRPEHGLQLAGPDVGAAGRRSAQAGICSCLAAVRGGQWR